MIGRKSIWIVPETKETIFVALLKLEAGCLFCPRSKDSKPLGRRSKPSGSGKKKGNQSSDAKKIQDFVWCYFPGQTFKGPAGDPLKISASDLEEALEGLPLVNALLPKHERTPLSLY